MEHQPRHRMKIGKVKSMDGWGYNVVTVTKRACCFDRSSPHLNYFERIFRCYGRFVATYPYVFLVVPILITIGTLPGFIYVC